MSVRSRASGQVHRAQSDNPLRSGQSPPAQSGRNFATRPSIDKTGRRYPVTLESAGSSSTVDPSDEPSYPGAREGPRAVKLAKKRPPNRCVAAASFSWNGQHPQNIAVHRPRHVGPNKVLRPLAFGLGTGRPALMQLTAGDGLNVSPGTSAFRRRGPRAVAPVTKVATVRPVGAEPARQAHSEPDVVRLDRPPNLVAR